MKKIVTTLSLIAGNLMIASAQVQANIQIGQSAQQGQINGGAILGLLALAQTIVTRLVPFAVGVAVLFFFFYLIKFISQSSNPGEQEKSKAGMGWSILALFLMVSIWGIIGLIGSIFGVGQGGMAPIPGVPVPSN